MIPKTLPALKGLPFLGNILDYRRDHLQVFWQAYLSLGPIFSMRLGPQHAAVFIGPKYNRFFFTEVDNILSMPEVYKFVIPMFGQVLNAAPTDIRKKQIALLHHAFEGKNLHSYVEVMAHETMEWLDTLGLEGKFNLWNEFETLALKIATKSLLGNAMRERIDEFLPLLEDLANGMEFVLPPNLPLPRFLRRDRARQKLVQMIQPMIAERQSKSGNYNDFLQVLADAKYLDNSPMPNNMIVDLTLLTAFTGYITTAAQGCWTLVQLLQHPHYLDLVLKEQEAVLGTQSKNVSVKKMGQLHQLRWALKETERLRPVMSHYARYNAQSYELGGYHVPKGWLTMICPAISHRLPDIFPNPEVYDPKRFAPERAEDEQSPYSLIGFGGGVYRCPGMSFGINEIQTILSLLLQQYRLELEDPDPKPNYDMGVIRPDPILSNQVSTTTIS